MPLYIVSCYSPPSALKIKREDAVKVEGWMQKENIRAEEIENLTEKGPTCQCESPPLKGLEIMIGIPKWVTKKGTVKKVIVTKESIQFELETDE